MRCLEFCRARFRAIGGERTGSGVSAHREDREDTAVGVVDGGSGVVVLTAESAGTPQDSESVSGSESAGSTFVWGSAAGGAGGGGAPGTGSLIVDSDGTEGTRGVVGKLNNSTIPKTNSASSPSSSFLPVSGGGVVAVAAPAAGVSTTTVVAAGTTTPAVVSKKRPKLDTVGGGGGSSSPDVENDISALKKLILEHKYMRLRSIKDRYNEHVAELFFLQTGGSMMEYPQSTRAQNIVSTTPGTGVNNFGGVTTTPSGNGSDGSVAGTIGLPQGAEIKIPAVGATPVAVSTTLPAAVAQLSQQGGTPIIPDRIGGIGATAATPTTGDRKKLIAASGALSGHAVKAELLDAVIGANGPTVRAGIAGNRAANSSIASTSSRLQSSIALNSIQQNGESAGSLANASASTNTNGPPDQYTNKARQEVFVMQRVQELQKEGLWTEKRLPKVQEPPRPKAHWDYLLEEMVWLAADFAQERKWKKACARKCARMVQKHFQDKALAAQRAEKAQELQLKRIAAFVAREIKTFWSNAEKLVEYKQQMKLEEKRKKALDQQLRFIVDQTEKYSQQLVEGMNKTVGTPVDGSKAASLNSSRISSPRRTGEGLTGSDDEFRPDEADSSDDDEETIAKAEAEAAEAEDGTKDEVAALQKESEMDLDDFLRNLPKDYLENRDKIVLSDPDRDDDEEEEEEGEQDEESAARDVVRRGASARRKKDAKEPPKGEEEMEEEDGDKDFSADEDSTDDEDTIREQEKSERNQDHKKELDELNADNEMSIEELMAKYKNLPAAGEKMELDSDDDADEPETSVVRERKRRRTRNQPLTESSPSDDEEEEEEEEDASEEDNSEGLTGSDDELSMEEEEEEEEEADVSDADEAAMETEDEEDAIGLKHLLDDETGSTTAETATGASAAVAGSSKSHSEKDDMLNDAAAIAESIQPKGNTLSSTSVVTPIPVLLKHSLREYQHIGLDWLVTMHDRKLNGILADEMGLGKTIQTISLLAHLACVKGNWGPHLIIVPSSVMLNWEMEFKKWCPGFKILTYYGTPKERKMKRTGWTKVNAFHVCITSYKLVIQDHQSFRRKKWKYLILDEAQNIKNFKSQRWQLLLNFQTEQRLLLTGTPLQNNLMELWSLMHFLMPHVFQSHREFKEWFSNPMSGMIEGNSEYNETIIKRLHKVLRPFLLRRLKSEVEKQMPKKYEHVVMCRLSKRQRFLYDDFMSRAKTRETLATGNLLSVINVLMQLRKVCNHPNMFEERPTISPFRMEGISIRTASLVYNMFHYDPFTQIDLSSLNLVLIQLELLLPAYVAHRSQHLCMPKRLIEEIDSTPLPPPRCPTGKLRLHVRIPDVRVQESIGNRRAGYSASTGVRIGTSPAMKTEGMNFVPLVNHDARASLDKKATASIGGTLPIMGRIGRGVGSSQTVMMIMGGGGTANADSSGGVGSSRSASPGLIARKRCDNVMLAGSSGSGSMQLQSRVNAGQVLQIIPQPSGGGGSATKASQSYIIATGRLQPTVAGQRTKAAFEPAQRLATVDPLATNTSTIAAPAGGVNRMVQNVGHQTQISSTLAATIMKQLKHSSAKSASSNSFDRTEQDEEQRQRNAEFYLACIEESRKERRREVLELLGRINAKRCDATPIYGQDLRETLCALIDEEFRRRPDELIPFGVASAYYTRRAVMARCSGSSNAAALVASWSLAEAIKTIDQRADELRATISNFVLFVPAVCAPTPFLQVSHPHPSKLNAEQRWETTMTEQIRPAIQLLHPIISAMSTQFPDPRLIQYDCGKLQTLDRLLKKLKSEGHRVLIFTQMTRMLDVLEAFLNYHGHIYLRLDGTTKVEQRQVLMERFNNDRRMFAFILSTRSGGVGINLTGADTVIFYDSDWNPTMDAQAQDRCHRIGQTRDVHIYRLVSEKTIEENILKKANQKRILGDLAIEGGNFTTAYFKSSTTIQDLFTVDNAEQDASARLAEVLDRDRERKDRLNANLSAGAVAVTATTAPPTTSGGEADTSKSAINVFESALAAAEDDQDVQAAKFAKAEASADLDEFDENIPIDEERAAAGNGEADDKKPELSKAEKEVQNLIKQLSGIERYAMRFVEDTEGTWTAVQLRVVEQEMEQQKRDWEANRLAEQRREEEAARKREAEEHADLLTFSREDAKNQVLKNHPSNSVRYGGSGRKRLRRFRRNDRSVSRELTKTRKRDDDVDGGTVVVQGKTRTTNSRGQPVTTKFDGGAGSRRQREQQTLVTVGGSRRRRVLPSAGDGAGATGVTNKRSIVGNMKPVAATNKSLLGKRKHHEEESDDSRHHQQKGGKVNLRQMKGNPRRSTTIDTGRRKMKQPRLSLSAVRSSNVDDKADEHDDDECSEAEESIREDKDGSESEADGRDEYEEDPLAVPVSKHASAKKSQATVSDDSAVMGGKSNATIAASTRPLRHSDSNQMNNYYSNSIGHTHDEDARHPKDHHSRPASRTAGGRRSRDARSKTPSVATPTPPVVENASSSELLAADGEGSDGGEVGSSSTVTVVTPRTRSRGTVKINLWTLDDSPMLPVNKRSARSKTPSQQQPNHASDGESESSSNGKKHSTTTIEDCPKANHVSVSSINSSHSKDEEIGNAVDQQRVAGKPTGNVSIMRNVKVLVNDLLRNTDAGVGGAIGEKRMITLSDGFRTPTPTTPKLRRLKRLSKVTSPSGGSSSSSSSGGSNTLDAWLTKGAGKPPTKESTEHGTNAIKNHVQQKGADVAAGNCNSDAATASQTVGDADAPDEVDPLANGEV
uniref:Helicase domino n=1 Tax=Anopheles farauti TaxID=69004 RepID=A0A182QDT2_9DIPT